MENPSKCSVVECARPTSNVGLCSVHYRRKLRHGDPLAQVRTPPGTRERFYQEVILRHSSRDCLYWPFGTDGQGYASMTVDGGRSVNVHRRVCIQVHGDQPNDKSHAAHSCGRGVRGCVSPLHVSWKTPTENSLDKNQHGTMLRGSMVVGSKLTENQIIEILKLKGVERQKDTEARFGISQGHVCDIQSGKKWRHLI